MDYLKELENCVLCEHRCGVDRLAGEFGVCRTGLPEVASRTLHPAPPESYTVFMAGCNFKCLNCQNWSISQYPDNRCKVDGWIEPDKLALECVGALNSHRARNMGADRVFFSGGEPSISLPYVEKVVFEAREIEPDLKVNFDTNGYMTPESLDRVLGFADSLTYDLKAFHEDTHGALTGCPPGPVLRNAEILAEKAGERIWEFRVTVVPGVNEDDLKPMCDFLAGLSRDVPVSFLAFRPNFVLDTHPGTPREVLQRAVDQASAAGLNNVTWAGMPGLPGEFAEPDAGIAAAYDHPGAARAAAASAGRGCVTSPRDCLACNVNHDCRLKRYRPASSS
jgi:pyruvate formate lyase activating enzyme